MHVLCFDCALRAAESGPHEAVPAMRGRSCPVCGSENPFDLDDIAFDARPPSQAAAL